MGAGVVEAKPSQQQPFKDWPSDAGVYPFSTDVLRVKILAQFETFHAKKAPIDLRVTGKIAAYAA